MPPPPPPPPPTWWEQWLAALAAQQAAQQAPKATRVTATVPEAVADRSTFLIGLY